MLTKTEMSPACVALVQQIADWDSIEETWEIHAPMPKTINVKTDADMIDLMMEFDQFCDDNDVSYFGFVQCDHGFSVTGLLLL
jgi:hypothetical protein